MSNQQNHFTEGSQKPAASSNLQSLLDYSPDIICSFDEKGRFISLSSAVKNILGYEPFELLNQPYVNFLFPADLAKTAAAVNSLNAGERVIQFENRYQHKEGKLVTLNWSAQQDIETGVIHAVARDNTQIAEEQKKAEAYKQRLSRAYHLARIAWWEWNADTNSLVASEELYHIYGLDEKGGDKLSTDLFLSMVHPEDLPLVKAAFEKKPKQEFNSYQHRFIKPSGEVIYIIHYVQSVVDKKGNLLQMHGTTKDITERKTAEQVLKKSRRTLKTILDSINDGFFTLDKNWKVTYWNAKAEELLLKKKTEILGKNIWEEFADAIPLKFYTEYHRAVKENVPVHFEEYFPPLSLWMEVSAYPFKDVLTVYFRDVTKRKQQEKALLQSNQRYETITSATFDAIWDYDLSTGSLYKSNGFCEMYGLEGQAGTDEVLFWKKNIHPHDLKRVLSTYQMVLEKGHTTWFQEFRFRKKNGEYAHVQDKGVAETDSKGYPIRLIGALRDVSETKYLQALEHLEKEVLERNAIAVHTLEDVIHFYLVQIEALHPGIYCSILKRVGAKLYNLSSPSLPPAFTAAIDGIEIGATNGSCGTAAFTGQKITTQDIATDPLWKDYKELPLKYGLLSCWSHPILNSEGNVLATFAFYTSEKKGPSLREEKTIERAVHVLKIILEKHQKEKALQVSLQRFNYVTQATSDAIWDWDLETNTVVRGEGFITYYGYQFQNLRDNADSWVTLIHPNDREKTVDSITAAITDGSTTWQADYRCKKSDGTYAEVADKGFIIRNEKGDAVRMVGAMQDVTKHKEADRRLKLSEERFRLLFDKSPKPKLMFLAKNWQVVEVNDAALKLYGYTREEFLQLSILDIKEPGDHEEMYQLQQQNLNSFHDIVRHVKKSGENFYIEITTHAIDLPSGPHFIVDGDDMSEKLELQQKLIEEKVKAQKRVGEAVLNAQEQERGEIGRELHDNVNQILTSAKLYQEMALTGTGDPASFIRQSIELMMLAINENRRLSKRLSATTLGNIKLSESVQELVDLVQSTNKFRIRLDNTAINELEVDQQVHLAMYRILQEHLTNIQRYADATNVLIFFEWVDDYLVLKISDDGKGFDMGAKRKGIGISNMTMRAESLGGNLVINSAPGIGCVIIVSIPFYKNNQIQ